MATIAERYQERGVGLVAMAGFAEDMDLKYRCYSTVSKNDIYAVLERVAANVSLMPHDLASLMTGDFVVSPPNPDLCELVQWGADFVNREEPLIIAAVAEGQFAAFVVGDGPMIVYMAVRMITTLRENRDFDFNEFAPSMN
jgi:hypothetical protein